MNGEVGRMFTKLLHFGDFWFVKSVNVNDDETLADIRVSVKIVPKIVCDCGCACICHDRGNVNGSIRIFSICNATSLPGSSYEMSRMRKDDAFGCSLGTEVERFHIVVRIRFY